MQCLWFPVTIIRVLILSNSPPLHWQACSTHLLCRSTLHLCSSGSRPQGHYHCNWWSVCYLRLQTYTIQQLAHGYLLQLSRIRSSGPASPYTPRRPVSARHWCVEFTFWKCNPRLKTSATVTRGFDRNFPGWRRDSTIVPINNAAKASVRERRQRIFHIEDESGGPKTSLAFLSSRSVPSMEHSGLLVSEGNPSTAKLRLYGNVSDGQLTELIYEPKKNFTRKSTEELEYAITINSGDLKLWAADLT